MIKIPLSPQRCALPIALGLILLPIRVGGQESGVGWRLCEADAPGSAVVSGRLIPQDEEAQPRRTVQITEVGGPFSCRIRASEDGGFEFRGVPAGSHQVSVFIGAGGTLGIREIAPIPVTIGTDTLVQLAIPIHDDDPLARCLTLGWCASVLTRRTPAELAGPEEQALRLLGYRLAIVLPGGSGDFGPDWVICVEDRVEVLDALRETLPNVAPRSECELRETQLEGMYAPREMLRHLPSDRSARAIQVGRLEKSSATSAVVSVSHYVGRLWAAGFECQLEETEGIWMPLSCRMTIIS